MPFITVKTGQAFQYNKTFLKSFFAAFTHRFKARLTLRARSRVLRSLYNGWVAGTLNFFKYLFNQKMEFTIRFVILKVTRAHRAFTWRV
jgi:hypothetical protein